MPTSKTQSACQIFSSTVGLMKLHELDLSPGLAKLIIELLVLLL